MTVFQIAIVTAMLVLLAVESLRYLSGRSRSLWDAVRICIWLLAAVAVAWPELVTHVAKSVGIRRGADLVLYVFVLAFLGTTFYFYSRYVRLQRQITELIRRDALLHAQQGRGTD